jgi:TolB-like protein/Tfp pilus assembly protein PilF
MQSFIAELRRRNVLRAAAFYAAAGWLLVQVATQVFPFFHIPEWVVRAIVVAALLGFPFAMLFAWFYELTPEGIKLESEVDHSRSITRQTGRALDRWIIAVLGLAVVLLLANTFVVHRDAAPAAAVPDKSIAVLPFSDLSPQHDEEYFSDGMAEELLNALAKVQDLKVAGRTSSFSFKGRNEDLRSIGQQLAVANVLEGSVRKQGNKVRITAQLIHAADGYHLWSESYDGDLNDIFDLQERIARAITEQLRVVLAGGQQQRLVPVATENSDAYALYLRATTVFNHRDGPHFADAISELQEAIRLDPGYARAHARLASLYSIAVNYTPMPLDEALAATEREARAASALDAKLAEPYAALGEIYDTYRRPLDAREALFKAVALDPGDANASIWLGSVLYAEGYKAEGNAWFDKGLAIDPLLPIGLFYRGMTHLWAGELEPARRMNQQALDAGLPMAERTLGYIALQEGRRDEAATHLARGERAFVVGLPGETPEVMARAIAGDAAARTQGLAIIDAYLAQHADGPISGAVPWALMMLDEPAQALAVGGARLSNNDGPFFFTLWGPYGAAVRRQPQFPEFTRQVGWAGVWDRYGPPPGCARAGAGYRCD